MIKPVKQQRKGASYLHAVLADAVRPYRYRESASQLLSKGIYRAGLRSRQLNMPPGFHYMNRVGLGYGASYPEPASTVAYRQSNQVQAVSTSNQALSEAVDLAKAVEYENALRYPAAKMDAKSKIEASLPKTKAEVKDPIELRFDQESNETVIFEQLLPGKRTDSSDIGEKQKIQQKKNWLSELGRALEAHNFPREEIASDINENHSTAKQSILTDELTIPDRDSVPNTKRNIASLANSISKTEEGRGSQKNNKQNFAAFEGNLKRKAVALQQQNEREPTMPDVQKMPGKYKTGTANALNARPYVGKNQQGKSVQIPPLSMPKIQKKEGNLPTESSQSVEPQVKKTKATPIEARVARRIAAVKKQPSAFFERSYLSNAALRLYK